VEEALAKAGARPGCPVTIGHVTFDWEPSTPAGIAIVMSGRGTDRRLEEESNRLSATERKAARNARRRHLSDAELAEGASYEYEQTFGGQAADDEDADADASDETFELPDDELEVWNDSEDRSSR
jgi:GTP-binding protein